MDRKRKHPTEKEEFLFSQAIKGQTAKSFSKEEIKKSKIRFKKIKEEIFVKCIVKRYIASSKTFFDCVKCVTKERKKQLLKKNNFEVVHIKFIILKTFVYRLATIYNTVVYLLG